MLKPLATPLGLFTKFIASNQKEETITGSIQRVKKKSQHLKEHVLLLG